MEMNKQSTLESNLRNTVLTQVAESTRFWMAKLIQGIIIYLGITGFSFTLVFDNTLQPKLRLITIIINLFFSVGLIAFSWFVESFIRKANATMQRICGQNVPSGVIPSGRWTRSIILMLNLFVLLAIPVWIAIAITSERLW